MATRRVPTPRDIEFQHWMDSVDQAIGRLTWFGLSSADLPDLNYRDAFDGGETPAQLAHDLLDEEGMVESDEDSSDD